MLSADRGDLILGFCSPLQGENQSRFLPRTAGSPKGLDPLLLGVSRVLRDDCEELDI